MRSNKLGMKIPAGLGLIAALLVLGCASSEDLTRKQKGDRAFAKGDYAQAIQEYQIYLEEGMAAGDAMEAQFKLARSFFQNKDYPTAAVEFEIFQRDYPRSDSLEAAAYYEALSWVEQAPAFDRDATLTRKAIRILENFLLDYPGSSYSEQASAQIIALNEKLARKSLAIARLYQNMGRGEAAIIYYEKLLREHPESRYWEEGARELLELFLELERPDEARRLQKRIEVERPGSELASSSRALLEQRQ